MDTTTLGSREYEFSDFSIEPLEIYEDPSGILRGGVGSTIWDAAIVLAKYLERSPLIPSSTSTATVPPPFRVLELGAGTGIVGLAVARLMQSRKIPGQVVLTDKENVLPLLQKNVDKNPCPDVQLTAEELDWVAVSGIPARLDPEDSTEGEQGETKEEADPQLLKPTADSNLPLPTENATKSDMPSSSTASSAAEATSASKLLNVAWDMVLLSDCIWISGLYEPLLGTLNLILPVGSKGQLVIAFEKRKFNEEMEFFASLGKTFRFRDIKPEEQDPTWQSEDIYLFVCQRRS
ncbi:hypothetical protein EMPS_01692 [Entomortierella parvispora]|uniref:Methyltransferase-domain-containing protein n=1 Tax=Entomortierella parvispora TaxID=205924 RepID=A0A9P3H3D1_9FUNG|nr:hypothetical protein EMPS_01692 [Entomortierella parvispora]